MVALSSLTMGLNACQGKEIDTQCAPLATFEVTDQLGRIFNQKIDDCAYGQDKLDGKLDQVVIGGANPKVVLYDPKHKDAKGTAEQYINDYIYSRGIELRPMTETQIMKYNELLSYMTAEEHNSNKNHTSAIQVNIEDREALNCIKSSIVRIFGGKMALLIYSDCFQNDNNKEPQIVERYDVRDSNIQFTHYLQSKVYYNASAGIAEGDANAYVNMNTVAEPMGDQMLENVGRISNLAKDLSRGN